MSRRRRGAQTPDKTAPKGNVGAAFAKEEAKAANRTFAPFRFFQGKGESCEVVILDESIEEGHVMYEHNVQGSDGKWGNLLPCIKDSGNICPNCKEHGDNSYLVLLLSVIVLKPYQSKKTGETHEHSKMILPIKRGLYPKFEKLEAIASRKKKTLRGAVILLERDTSDTSFSTGEPVPNEEGQAIDWYSEDELIEEFGHEAILDRDKKVVRAENDDLVVYDYKKIYPDMSDKLAEEAEPANGSVDQEEEEFGSPEDEDDIPMDRSDDQGEEEAESEEEAPTRPRSRRRSRGKKEPF